MNTGGFRGYIFSREIRGQIIPQRLQNLVVRTYAQKRELPYLLSATEYYMPNCYMMLDSLVDEERPHGIIFYSLHMLPDNPENRGRFYEKCLLGGIEVHFALENLKIRSRENTKLIEDIKLVALACEPDLSF